MDHSLIESLQPPREALTNRWESIISSLTRLLFIDVLEAHWLLENPLGEVPITSHDAH
jgi:hypothetical protein